jgi:hypothetical protein
MTTKVLQRKYNYEKLRKYNNENINYESINYESITTKV